ncbi:MAG TPA: hypothetical protein PKW45_05035 [Bryobacteraceae bacterium]|nr:hypothetical protein [Bryobacteraceae bacterium]
MTCFHNLHALLLLFVFLFPVLVAAQTSNEDPEPGPSFQWGPAIRQANRFLAIEHLFRLGTEAGTREGLKGPFFRDYARSVRSLRGWDDGDPFLVNYIGHPMGGAVAGFIAVHNDLRYRRVQFGRSPHYWKSRLRAMAFAAIYSEQFEIGPISEASIGNIQMTPPATGIVDHVITPTAGMGWMIAEDALDRYVVRRFENWTTHPVARILVRGFLNPTRSFSNILRGKYPWYRDDRGGVTD